ncbi:hypothetical protein QTP88_026506 [Uroleucon formosanum]
MMILCFALLCRTAIGPMCQCQANLPNLDGKCYLQLRVGLLLYDLGHGCVGGEMLGFRETVSCYFSWFFLRWSSLGRTS